jgi:hypothetical protein
VSAERLPSFINAMQENLGKFERHQKEVDAETTHTGKVEQ